MVKQVQTIDEYYDFLDDDDDDYLFYAPTYFEYDEQLVILACLMLLEKRYQEIKSMTLQRIVEEIDEIIDSLNEELSSVARIKMTAATQEYYNFVMDNFNVPDKYVNADTSMIEIAVESINTLCNLLKGELKQKAMFFEDNISKGSFDILPNFKRAIQRVVDAVGNNLIYSKVKTRRNVYEFVYGKDKLYRWLTANDDKVCAWCRMQESLPPRTLKEMPLDHPRGRCIEEPVDYTYSDEYYTMLARGEYRKEIDAFTPESIYDSWEV